MSSSKSRQSTHQEGSAELCLYICSMPRKASEAIIISRMEMVSMPTLWCVQREVGEVGEWCVQAGRAARGEDSSASAHKAD